MKINVLQIKNYRNIEALGLDLNKNKILIVGKNAQGKTNILESIYFISSLKTPRTSVLTELINHESDFVEIEVQIEKSGVEIELAYYNDKSKKRELKTNKLKTKPKEFKNIISCVLFSTEDLMLIRGNPEDRRGWLDFAISQIYPAYDDRLSKYNKIRVQKNNFLKEYNSNQTLFEVYNEQLAILGSNIIYLRKKFLKEIEKKAKEKHSQISGEEKLKIEYESSFITKETEIEEILEKFKEKLEERKDLEIIRGQSLVGPHRDDIKFLINENDATKFASQGQQRTIVLSLKLAEIDIIKEKIGDSPILLLDDVLAELDDVRQNYLLQAIEESTQTIITSVDTLLFDKKFLDDVKIYTIEKGQVV